MWERAIGLRHSLNCCNRMNFIPAVSGIVIENVGPGDFYACSLGQRRKLLREALAGRNCIWLGGSMGAHSFNDKRVVLLAPVDRIQHVVELRVQGKLHVNIPVGFRTNDMQCTGYSRAGLNYGQSGLVVHVIPEARIAASCGGGWSCWGGRSRLGASFSFDGEVLHPDPSLLPRSSLNMIKAGPRLRCQQSYGRVLVQVSNGGILG